MIRRCWHGWTRSPDAYSADPVTTRGFLLGNFMPPHAGHVALCQMAAALVDELTVMVCTLESEPMPAGLRAAWMRGLLPGVNVVHHDRDMPQSVADHPDFWSIWGRAMYLCA